MNVHEIEWKFTTLENTQRIDSSETKGIE